MVASKLFWWISVANITLKVQLSRRTGHSKRLCGTSIMVRCVMSTSQERKQDLLERCEKIEV